LTIIITAKSSKVANYHNPIWSFIIILEPILLNKFPLIFLVNELQVITHDSRVLTILSLIFKPKIYDPRVQKTRFFFENTVLPCYPQLCYLREFSRTYSSWITNNTCTSKITTVCVKDCGLQNQKYQYNNLIYMFSWLAQFFSCINLYKIKAQSLKKKPGWVYSRAGINISVHMGLRVCLWGPQSLAHCVVWMRSEFSFCL